jgi:arginase
VGKLIAVPYHLGHRGIGTGAGPLRLLEAAGGQGIVVEVTEPAPHETSAAFAVNRALAEAVRGEPHPLILAGNCNHCVGALAAVGEPAGIIWFDAHGDFNTPETSPSGFLDGMALAIATGRCWRSLAASVPGFRPVPEEHVLLAGARDLDPAERQALESSRVMTSHASPDRLQPALDLLARRVRRVYLHVDVDVLDPREAVVNQYATPGGITLAQLLEAIRMVQERFEAPAAAIASYNPECDQDGKGAAACLAILQAFGKKN